MAEYFLNTPSGAIELKVDINDSRVADVFMNTGFVCRNIEKLSRKKKSFQIMPFVERVEQRSHNHYSVCLCSLFEEALKIKLPSSVEIIRTILLEVERVYSHLCYMDDVLRLIRTTLISSEILKLKEFMLDLFENISGHRMYSNNHAVGGVRFPFTPGKHELINKFVLVMNEEIEKLEEYVLFNPAVHSILFDLGKVDIESLNSKRVSGPIAWSGGVMNDLRISDPYLCYAQTEISQILKKRIFGDHSCAFERLKTVLEDIRSSLLIVEVLNEKATSIIEPEPHFKPNKLYHEIPGGTYKSKIETAKGLLQMDVFVDKTGEIESLTINSPSAVNINALPIALKDSITDYITLIFTSLDISMLEVDR